MNNPISTNLIVSYKVMTKKQYENYKSRMTSKDVHTASIIENFSDKPRFSIDMVQNELLKVSKHFISEKNNKKEVTSSDIAFIKDTFKVCFYIAMEKKIYFDFCLQNGVVTFLRKRDNPFSFSKKDSVVRTDTEKMKTCFNSCSKNIDLSKVDKDYLKEVIATLSKYVK